MVLFSKCPSQHTHIHTHTHTHTPFENCYPPQFWLDFTTINFKVMNQKAITFDYDLSDNKATVMLVGVNATNANNPVAAANPTNANPPFTAGLKVKLQSAFAIIAGLHASIASKRLILAMDSDNSRSTLGFKLRDFRGNARYSSFSGP
jgi:hypothetical protein